jgi:hypothetical protein
MNRAMSHVARRFSILVAPLMLLLASGCATGYTRKAPDGFERPERTVVLAETMVFQRVPDTNVPAVLLTESVAFGRAVCSGAVARLAAQGIAAHGTPVVAVQQRGYPLLALSDHDATDPQPAVPPLLVREAWREDTNRCIALSSIFTTLDQYAVSAMTWAVPRGEKLPKSLKPEKLAFDPAELRLVFGEEMPPVVVLLQGCALAREPGRAWKDAGLAFGLAIGTALITGGAASSTVVPVYPWFLKAVAVDTATGEVVWADWWKYDSGYKPDDEQRMQGVCADRLVRRSPVFKQP